MQHHGADEDITIRNPKNVNRSAPHRPTARNLRPALYVALSGTVMRKELTFLKDVYLD